MGESFKDRRPVRGSLAPASVVVLEDEWWGSSVKAAHSRVEGLRYGLDPKSKLGLDQRNGVFSFQIRNREDIEGFLRELKSDAERLNRILMDPSHEAYRNLNVTGKNIAVSIL